MFKVRQFFVNYIKKTVCCGTFFLSATVYQQNWLNGRSCHLQADNYFKNVVVNETYLKTSNEHIQYSPHNLNRYNSNFWLFEKNPISHHRNNTII